MDGLIYVTSIAMLDSARRGAAESTGSCPGEMAAGSEIAATLAANVVHGLTGYRGGMVVFSLDAGLVRGDRPGC